MRFPSGGCVPCLQVHCKHSLRRCNPDERKATRRGPLPTAGRQHKIKTEEGTKQCAPPKDGLPTRALPRIPNWRSAAISQSVFRLSAPSRNCTWEYPNSLSRYSAHARLIASIATILHIQSLVVESVSITRQLFVVRAFLIHICEAVFRRFLGIKLRSPAVNAIGEACGAARPPTSRRFNEPANIEIN